MVDERRYAHRLHGALGFVGRQSCLGGIFTSPFMNYEFRSAMDYRGEPSTHIIHGIRG